MKKIVLSLLFLGISFPVFSSDSVNGFVEQVAAGELDPYFGDACVVVLRTQENRLLGLVNRDIECTTDSSVAALEALRWKWISVDRSGLDRIRNKRDLKFLREEINKKAMYYEWDGVIDSELSVSFEKVETLGRKMMREEIGGNAGALELYTKVQYDPRTGLSLRDVIRQLLYVETEYLEDVSVLDLPGSDGELKKAAFALIPSKFIPEDQDPWAKFRKKLTDTLIDLASETTRDENERRYLFFDGELGGRDNYSAYFIAVYNRRTSEVVILIQGYSE
ncbi:MAG: hypothetical protein HYY61_01775 [Deltaproteobacteria bacterium]|nr:hypothetical protein [Deltaproteobacteria bacterium]